MRGVQWRCTGADFRVSNLKLLVFFLRGRYTYSIEVGDVGNETTDSSRLPGLLVHGAEDLGRGVEVPRPAEPTGMASVEIKSDVVMVQGFEGVDGALVVGIGRVCAFLYPV